MDQHAALDTPEPPRPDDVRSRAIALRYGRLAQWFQDAGVRVVNLGWRDGPATDEAMPAFHNVGGLPAMLFVARSGNEDNSADFQNDIPACRELPNLITVGRTGPDTSSSTFGRKVVVHANGFEVDSMVPGGDRPQCSGASAVSPQVAELATTLVALRTTLTALRVKALILDGAARLPGADGQLGRARLVHPRCSAELAGLQP